MEFCKFSSCIVEPGPRGGYRRKLQEFSAEYTSMDVLGGIRRLIQERFSKDQYQMLLRQLFHIRQMGTVVAYYVEVD